jgi:hypothetical protein
MKILRSHQPLREMAEDYVFTMPTGAPIDEQNFFNKEWLPTLRAKEIRPRPFYNTRHSYASFLFSIGARSGFISAQLGDSIKTLETHYARYMPSADDSRELVERKIAESETLVKPPFGARTADERRGRKKPLVRQGLKSGAGEEGRTPDLMQSRHKWRKNLDNPRANREDKRNVTENFGQ